MWGHGQEIGGPVGDEAGKDLAQQVERVNIQTTAGWEDGQVGGEPFSAILTGDEEVVLLAL